MTSSFVKALARYLVGLARARLNYSMSVARAAVISVYSTAPRDIFQGQHEQTSALSSNKCIMSLIAESAKQMYMYQGRIKYMHVLET